MRRTSFAKRTLFPIGEGFAAAKTGRPVYCFAEKSELLPLLRKVKAGASLADITAEENELFLRYRKMGVLSVDSRNKYEAVLAFLNQHITARSDFQALKAGFDALVSELRSCAEAAGAKLTNLFDFVSTVWGDGQEILILVTELTIGYYASRFLSRYGCEAYDRHSESLRFYERNLEIRKKTEALWQHGVID